MRFFLSLLLFPAFIQANTYSPPKKNVGIHQKTQRHGQEHSQNIEKSNNLVSTHHGNRHEKLAQSISLEIEKVQKFLERQIFLFSMPQLTLDFLKQHKKTGIFSKAKQALTKPIRKDLKKLKGEKAINTLIHFAKKNNYQDFYALLEIVKKNHIDFIKQNSNSLQKNRLILLENSKNNLLNDRLSASLFIQSLNALSSFLERTLQFFTIIEKNLYGDKYVFAYMKDLDILQKELYKVKKGKKNNDIHPYEEELKRLRDLFEDTLSFSKKNITQIKSDISKKIPLLRQTAVAMNDQLKSKGLEKK
jgi:hypothetical protein